MDLWIYHTTPSCLIAIFCWTGHGIVGFFFSLQNLNFLIQVFHFHLIIISFLFHFLKSNFAFLAFEILVLNSYVLKFHYFSSNIYFVRQFLLLFEIVLLCLENQSNWKMSNFCYFFIILIIFISFLYFQKSKFLTLLWVFKFPSQNNKFNLLCFIILMDFVNLILSIYFPCYFKSKFINIFSITTFSSYWNILELIQQNFCHKFLAAIFFHFKICWIFHFLIKKYFFIFLPKNGKLSNIILFSSLYWLLLLLLLFPNIF